MAVTLSLPDAASLSHVDIFPPGLRETRVRQGCEQLDGSGVKTQACQREMTRADDAAHLECTLQNEDAPIGVAVGTQGFGSDG